MCARIYSTSQKFGLIFSIHINEKVCVCNKNVSLIKLLLLLLKKL